ncbi:MAG: CHAD domain-containing protein [Candidatus Devosia phytovorans]|uniref:CHAD domain-containing protein n=1 Tax=Candidatus Devosia phytovorans TaxID=3121372 RepID=A0AAJ5VWD9_9HYPH|nr:CHAD domain-containing protein [Devosia sp.]WEK05637.1 MAG: CHAD domain-containing protein [Devosia sp.]
MAFAFRQQGGIGEQVRKIARKQIERALEECDAQDADFDRTVHGLRRRCKRLRGLVQLIAPHFKKSKAEDKAFRDAAKGLAGTRDATVMVETFAALVEHDRGHGGIIEHDGRMLDWLKDQVGTPPDADEQADILQAFAKVFRKARKRARDWDISGHGFARIGDGLEQTYRQMRRDMAAAQDEGTAETMHEWRKQVKYHWHHVSLFQNTAPDLLTPRRQVLDKLGEYLGDHHNLAVLGDLLRQHEEAASKSDLILVRKAIAERQAGLAKDAFALGRQLTAEKPGTLRERFAQYWLLLPKKD